LSFSVSEGGNERAEHRDLIPIVVPAAAAAIVICAILIIVICVCKRKAAGSRTPSTINSTVKSMELTNFSDKSAPYIKEVPHDNITLLQELGTGAFGPVYKGQVFGLYGNNTASTVFAKVLKEKPLSEELQQFNEELSGMSNVRHQTVLSLLAVCNQTGHQCLLYEHLPMGDLRQFLLSQAGRGHMLTNREVMYMVTQIANAIEYLASYLFVHKDIAAHNVMVSQNLNVKISTLKITQGLYSNHYYNLHSKLLPIRWLPPETITYGRFSLETDVYSFGVLLWEAFSGGTEPYAGFSNQEVIEAVRSRELLALPNGCPPKIYSLMMECWHEMPAKRPTAKEVHQKMRAWYLDNSYATISTTTAPSGTATSSAPSHQSSNDGYTSNVHTNGKLPHVPYMDPAPTYYSTIDPTKMDTIDSPGSYSVTSCDDMSEVTESTHNPADGSHPPNYYSSTPHNRYASLSRGHRKHDTEFNSQSQPLFTDQV